MKAIKRVVSTSFWEDDKVIETFTPEDKYFMLYLLTNPHTKQLGIYQISIKQMAWEMGYSTDSIKSLLERFEKVHKIIKFSKSTNEIAILNYLCYAVIKGGKPVLDCLESDLKDVKNKTLFYDMLKHIKDRTDLLDTIKVFINNHIKDINNNDNDNIYLSNDNEIENDNDNANDNDNDNDNDSMGSVSLTYRGRIVNNKEKERKNNFKSLFNNYLKILNTTNYDDLDCDIKNSIFKVLNDYRIILDSSDKEDEETLNLFNQVSNIINKANGLI